MKLDVSKVSLLAMALTVLSSPAYAAPPYGPALPSACTGSDCVTYNILNTEDVCTQVTSDYHNDIRWAAGLSLEVDQAIRGGNIVAYKIQWSNGTWSPWYVSGVNDIDYKYNTASNTMRRMWSYFYDHKHSYIICKKKDGAF